MPIKTPTLEELGRIASRFGLNVTQDDLRSYQGLMRGVLASYNRLDQLPEPTLAVKYPRDAGYRPAPAENPLGAWYWRTHITGGSSSGSAALVAAGAVDMAIGGDQGGSIRIPSCWCGIYGLKPTYGLVPYTGIFPIELTLDHTGPMARTVADVALLLEVIAGPDGLDPRQRADQQGDAYTRALTGHARELRLGIVEEGFGWPGASEADVDAAVREAAHAFERLGATVTSLSLPLHRHGVDIWTAIGIEGATMLMVQGNSMGTNWKGHYATDLLDVYARGRLTRADDLSETV